MYLSSSSVAGRQPEISALIFRRHRDGRAWGLPQSLPSMSFEDGGLVAGRVEMPVMKIAVVLALLGLVATVAVVSVSHDLRGWAPSMPAPEDRIEATRPGAPSFTLGDCLPWAINPATVPTADEYSGTATMVVLTCRSRSSAARIVLACLGAIGAALAGLHLLRRRRKRLSAGSGLQP